MKAKDLRSLSKQELEKKLDELRSDLMKLRTGTTSAGQPKNVGQARNMKKTVARILTILTNK